jgi:hypothetical protein
MRRLLTRNIKKVNNLVRNYDAMTEEGKDELLLIGEKYLTEKGFKIPEEKKDAIMPDAEK